MYVFPTLALLLACACRQVNTLSDEASVERFIITSLQPDRGRAVQVIVSPGKIRVAVYPDDGIFPLSFSARLESYRAVDLLHFPDTFRFDTSDDRVTFYLIAPSGMPRPHEVSLEAMPTGADILGFEVEGATAAIDPWRATVRLAVDRPVFPCTIAPRVSLPDGASLRDTAAMIFTRVDDVKSLVVTSADGRVTREWTCTITGPVQLANAGFESWIGTGATINIDPTPANVWGTANNAFIQGTRPTEHDGGNAAEMTTAIQKVPLFGHLLVAAGTLYTGHFVMNLDFENPRTMTRFGVPHDRRVTAISFDARYVAGPRLQRSVKNHDSNTYEVIDVEGVDSGEAWAEMVYWEGQGDLRYHGEPVPGLTVVGSGRALFDGADRTLATWKTVVMPVTYTDDTRAPTHLVIVFTSSSEGDTFKGAAGSKLAVDNLVLLY
jgi:hypothetical protein